MARNKEFEKEDVLNKAMHLFWEKGYHATSAQDLVDRLKISRSSMYDTFRDKHTLYCLALQRYVEQSISSLTHVFSNDGDVNKNVEDLLRFLVQDAQTDPLKKGCFVVNAGAEMAAVDEEVRALVVGYEQQLYDLFFSVIRKSKEYLGHELADQTAKALACSLVNTVHGLRIAAKIPRDPDKLEALVLTYMDGFRR